jgi:hypothetical protein
MRRIVIVHLFHPFAFRCRDNPTRTAGYFPYNRMYLCSTGGPSSGIPEFNVLTFVIGVLCGTMLLAGAVFGGVTPRR